MLQTLHELVKHRNYITENTAFMRESLTTEAAMELIVRKSEILDKVILSSLPPVFVGQNNYFYHWLIRN
jgi:hypothetical protein